MVAKQALQFADIVQVLLCVSALSVMSAKRLVNRYPALAGLLLLETTNELLTLAVLFHRADLHLSRTLSSNLYFYSTWISSLSQFVLVLAILNGLFAEAMKPFPGLQRIGRVVFRWFGAASLAVAFAIGTGPEALGGGFSASRLLPDLAGRLQQGFDVLVLCLLIFVTFAIRPLGLTYRSHVFGILLGLGVMSTAELIVGAWLATVGALNLYSSIFLGGSIGMCLALLIWGTYFVLPEPKRRLILLPTTSPFFLWNRISEILGDAPGNVAIAGFTPDMLAPAEIEMLTAATSREAVAAREREAIALEFEDDEYRELSFASDSSHMSWHEHPVAQPAYALSR